MAGRYRALAAGFIVAALALGLRLYRFELLHTGALAALQAGTLPPGLHWDEAFNTLAALRLVREGGFEPFIRIDLGRMPLHIYLTTLIFFLAGPLTVGGRLAALIPGLLNVIIVVPLVQTVFADSLTRAERHRLAWLAAGQVAVTYWFVHFSRLGMEHSTLAFYSTLAMWGLWWAVRHPVSWRAIVAGGLLALAIYTYPAAYALPVVAGLGLAYLAFRRRSAGAVTWGFVLRYALGFGLVIAPLALFAWRYPEWVLGRPTGVGITTLTQFGQNIFNTLGGLLWRGDYNTSYNLRDRPFFDLFQAGLFLVGLGACARRFRQPPYAFALTWLGVMALPQVLSEAPHFGRVAGATVPAVLIAALGGLALWQRLRPRWRAWGEVGLAGLLVISGAWTARDYFVGWPQSPDFYQTFRVAERVEAELAAGRPDDVPNYISPGDGAIPTLRYLLNDRPDEAVKFFNGRVCSVWPPSESGARYLITAYEDTRTASHLAEAYGSTVSLQSYSVPGLRLVDEVTVPAGVEPELPDGSVSTPDSLVGGVLRPVAIRLPSTPITAATSELPLTLTWKVAGQTSEDLTLGLYLLGPDFPGEGYSVVSQVDSQPCDASYPTSRWTTGEWIVEERRLQLPPGVQPGRYTLALALYRWPSLERLPVLLPDGTPAGDLALLAEVQITAP